MNQTPAERAREIVSEMFRLGIGPDSHPQECAALLTAALTIPANHIRTPDGKDVKVLGEIPLTADGCLVGMHAKLHYFEEPYEQSHYPTDDSAFFDDIAFMNDEVVGGSVPFAKCFSTREAALTPTPTP